MKVHNENDLQQNMNHVEQQKAAMAEKMKANTPNCPQCGQKMTYIPEQSVVACQTCGIGMRV